MHAESFRLQKSFSQLRPAETSYGWKKETYWGFNFIWILAVNGFSCGWHLSKFNTFKPLHLSRRKLCHFCLFCQFQTHLAEYDHLTILPKYHRFDENWPNSSTLREDYFCEFCEFQTHFRSKWSFSRFLLNTIVSMRRECINAIFFFSSKKVISDLSS